MALTPVSDPRTLSVAVLYLLWGWASLDFPTTTRAHPSWLVYVHRSTRRSTANYDSYFPMPVHWDLWERVVVPVYGDDSIQPNVSENQFQVRDPQGVTDLLDQIEGLLRTQMIEQGYLPPVSP